MVSLSPKIEIINHFDNLIQQIDIDIEKCIKQYKTNRVLGELDCFRVENRDILIDYNKIVQIDHFDSNESSQNNKSESVIEWSESTKVIDYLNQVRQRTIEELRKAQEDSLEYLKSKSCDLNQIKQSKDVEEMKSRLFADKFYFQVFYKPNYQESWVFSLFTIVTDFYLSPSDISILENMINSSEYQLKIIDSNYYALVFDEKCALIYGIFEEFRKQSQTQQYLSHLIRFRQQDLLNIKSIYVSLKHLDRAIFKSSSNYLSKLESLELNHNYYQLDRVNIEGLSSLKSLSLNLESIEESSFQNLYSLKRLNLDIESEINNDMLTRLFEICPNIDELCLQGKFSNINFDCFTNLKKLRLSGDLSDDFNFDLFENICNQLEELTIGFKITDNEKITRLLCHYFPNLSMLYFQNSTSHMRILIKCQSLRIDPFENLNSSMKHVELHISSEINNDMLTKLFKICPNVEELFLSARDLNIYFYNKKLSLVGNLFDDFNFDFIKNISNQLEELSIKFENMNDESISKLLCRHNFGKITTFEIGYSKITRLDKNLFDGFQMLHSLDISRNKELKIIEKDAFSNLKNLKKLSLSFNQLSELDAEIFSCFKNLIELNLRDNNLTHFDLKIMDYIVNIKKIDLENNPKLVNKEEILNRFEQIKIN